MTLASWFASMWHTRRLAWTGARRNRSRAFHRRASAEALEDRFLLSSASFSTGTETVDESAGGFSIPVTLSGPPSAPPTISAFASGFDEPGGLAFDAAGNLYVASHGDGTVEEVSPAGAIINTISGFDNPWALAFDSAGNLYVANAGNNTVSSLARTGGVDGTLGAPRTYASGFQNPIGLAFDSDGNLYVANSGNDTVSEVPAGGGTPTTFASGFNAPGDLAFDSAGNLYVSNTGDNTLSKVSPAGAVSPFASGFDTPWTLAFDSAGNLYVSNFSDNTVSKVSPAGVVTTFASASEVSFPGGLAFDAAGNLYVSTADGTAVSKLSETVAVPFTLAGSAVKGTTFSGVTASPLLFGIGQTTLDITGTLLSDPGPSQTLTLTLSTPTGGFGLGTPSANTLTIIQPAVQFGAGSETVSEGAGTFSIPVTLSASPTVSTFASGFNEPSGVACDSAGNVYVTNLGSGKVSEVSPAGAPINTISGFNDPWGLAVDSAGNLYVANESDGTVSEVPAGGGAPTTFASGLNEPFSLAFDAAGNLYVANQGGEPGAGTVSEVPAGGGTPTTIASGFGLPGGLAVDSKGNVYVADILLGTVSKVTPAGVVSTFASGFKQPDGLAFDSAGNLYVVNTDAGTVSAVTPAGVVSTFATGFNNPYGMAFAAGSLYVANENDDAVLKVNETVTVPFALGGTAVAGIAYSGVTPSPLTFEIGKTTLDITGTLLTDPGPSQTLTFTLGTPAGNSAVGNISVNTLTITEPAKVGTPTPTSSPLAPVFLGEERVFSGKGKHKKLVGFEFIFSGALDQGDARSTANYRVTQKQGRKVNVLRVNSALDNSSNNSVTIMVGGFKTGKAAQVTIVGLAGANGEAIPQIASSL